MFMEQRPKHNHEDEISTTTFSPQSTTSLTDKILSGQFVTETFVDEDIIDQSNYKIANGYKLGCEKCIDGIILLSHEMSRKCDCYHRHQLYLRMKRSNIPLRYWEYEAIPTIGLRSMRKAYAKPESYFKPSDLNERIKSICQDVNQFVDGGFNMFLEGPTGSGKTTAAVLVAKAAILKEISTVFVESEELRNIMNGKTGDYHPAKLTVDRIREARLLIIDDLGKEFQSRDSNYQETQIDHLLRYRQNNNLATIFTTNLSKEDIIQRYTERVDSLISNNCVQYVVHREIDLRHNEDLPDFL